MGVTGTQRIFPKIPSFDIHSRWLFSNVFFFFKVAPLLTVVLGQDFAFWLRCFSSGLQR